MFFPLYIDPGTGSMLFSVVVGAAATVMFALRILSVKVKFLISGGKVKNLALKRLPFVIFSDHKRYWNVFKPICDEFEKRGVDLVYYTASEDDPVLTASYNHVHAEYLGAKNRPYARLNMLSADVLIATTPGLDVLQWKRSRDVKFYVHIPHTVDDLAGYRMFALDYYDAVLATGQNQVSLIRKIEGLRPSIAKKEVVITGSPNLDSMKSKLAALPPRTKNKAAVVLVAPSWGKSGILSRYGSEFLSALAKTDFNIIVRPHPQTVTSEKDILEKLMNDFPSSKRFEWNFDNDNFDVLNKADILITDFSGIIFDYTLVFDKPLIYADTEFDTLPYDADWLDQPMWALRVLPELGIQLKKDDFKNLESVIKTVLNDTNLKSSRKKIREECWANIGESAKLIADYLIEKQKSLSELAE